MISACNLKSSQSVIDKSSVVVIFLAQNISTVHRLKKEGKKEEDDEEEEEEDR